MLNQKKLAELNTGDDVNHFLLLVKVEVKTTRTNKEYLNLELKDSSNSLGAKIWDDFEDFLKNSEAGKVVKVQGKIEEFMGQPQIKINKLRLAAKEDNISSEFFMPRSKRNLEKMLEEFNNRIEIINNAGLKSLLKEIFGGERMEKFRIVPAGKAWHHAYIHGLLEHTLEVIRICDLMADIHSEVDRDLLTAGAFLHDLGKIEELTADGNFDYTDRGRLIGHIVIAALIIESEIKKINGFSELLKDKLLHLILSHQGKHEFATPVEPKTLEAIILYQADELSAKSNAYKMAIQSEENSRSNWTKFLHLANTSLYISRPEDEDNPAEKFFTI